MASNIEKLIGLTDEEIKNLKKNIQQELTLVLQGYDIEEDGWTSPTTTKERIILEDILGVLISGKRIITHFVGRAEGGDVVYCTNAWDDYVGEVRDAKGTTLWKNPFPHLFFESHLRGEYERKCELSVSRISTREAEENQFLDVDSITQLKVPYLGKAKVRAI